MPWEGCAPLCFFPACPGLALGARLLSFHLLWHQDAGEFPFMWELPALSWATRQELGCKQDSGGRHEPCNFKKNLKN